jgi:beta-1,4-N-acetylglucosaminyltransferase
MRISGDIFCREATMKVAVVSSCGGHLTEARVFAKLYERYSHFYVIDDEIELPRYMRDKTYIVSHSERDWRTLLNFIEAFRILKKERPTVILSTGAGIAVPFAIVGRFIFGATVIYIETMTRVNRPSLTGRLMYYVAQHFFYQWQGLHRFFPKGTYAGPLI